MTASRANGSVNSTVRKTVSYTTTGLRRWSVGGRELPPSSQIKTLHVYDFDNTLFASPLPNPKLWTTTAASFLQTQDCFTNGGWWHDQHILEATGQGTKKEEPKAWEGWWNENIVELVNLSLKQPDALTILLTGRAENNFADIVRRMVASKKLSFHLICLKPQAGPNSQIFTSTMMYKQALLKDLIYTYKDADEIRIYEDRPKQTRGFREFFDNFNKMLLSPTAPTPRKPITAEVIQVAERATTLDPVTETAEVQRMINAHNAALPPRGVGSSDRMEIKRTVFYTAYLVAPNDTAKLTTLIHLPSNMSGNDVKFLANNIMITARPCPPTILNRIGGNGHMQTWKITGTAVYESRVWVARVAPVPANSAVHTDHQVPMVVLGHLKNTRSFEALRIQNWQPVRPEEEFVFQTVVGERVQLRIEREIEGESEYEALFAHPNPKRRQPDEPRYEADNYRPSQSQSQRGNYSNDENRRSGQGNISGNYRSGNLSRGRGGGSGPGVRHPQHASGRGGRGGVGGGGGGGGGRGGGGNRGRGRGGYKSLDDVGNGGGRYGGQGSMYQNSQQPNYDDGPSYSAGNGDTFNASYPPLGGGSGRDNNNNGAGEGLPHGK